MAVFLEISVAHTDWLGSQPLQGQGVSPPKLQGTTVLHAQLAPILGECPLWHVRERIADTLAVHHLEHPVRVRLGEGARERRAQILKLRGEMHKTHPDAPLQGPCPCPVFPCPCSVHHETQPAKSRTENRGIDRHARVDRVRLGVGARESQAQFWKLRAEMQKTHPA